MSETSFGNSRPESNGPLAIGPNPTTEEIAQAIKNGFEAFRLRTDLYYHLPNADGVKALFELCDAELRETRSPRIMNLYVDYKMVGPWIGVKGGNAQKLALRLRIQRLNILPR